MLFLFINWERMENVIIGKNNGLNILMLVRLRSGFTSGVTVCGHRSAEKIKNLTGTTQYASMNTYLGIGMYFL